MLSITDAELGHVTGGRGDTHPHRGCVHHRILALNHLLLSIRGETAYSNYQLWTAVVRSVVGVSRRRGTC